MSYVLVVPPPCEPVTLAQVKGFCTIDFADADALLVGFISAAREACENWTWRRFITQSWRFYPEWRTSRELEGERWRFWGGCERRRFDLPFSPSVSVSDVCYLDVTGVQQQLVAGTDYAVNLVAEPGQIWRIPTSQWQINRELPNALWIDFVCGYGTPLAAQAPQSGYALDASGRYVNNPVPNVIQLAICMCVEQMYEQRGTLGDLPDAVKNLLMPYRVLS